MSRLLPAVLLASACADGGPPTTEESVDFAACEARDDDGFDVADGAATPEDAPIIALGTPTQVNLQAQQTHYVRVLLPEAGSFGIFAERDGIISGLTTDDGPVDLPEEVAPSVVCEELADAVVMEMPSGTVTITLGPSFQASTWLFADYGASPATVQ